MLIGIPKKSKKVSVGCVTHTCFLVMLEQSRKKNYIEYLF